MRSAVMPFQGCHDWFAKNSERRWRHNLADRQNGRERLTKGAIESLTDKGFGPLSALIAVPPLTKVRLRRSFQ
jgi:hypothetical protein